MKCRHPTFNATAPGRRRPACPRPLALAAACLFAAQPGHSAGPSPALPSGLQVVQGQATLATSGNRLTVSNSANALLNWQQFSIDAGHAVHFAQPSAASKVLNRVVGSDPSAILGRLSSNGQVWLLNPNGVLFGADARVDVAGLVASTLQLGDTDWAAGRFSLTGSANGVFGGVSGGVAGLAGGAASVVNQGELRTVNGGRVLLIGSGSVRNEGLIAAPDGQVLLAAGRSVELVDSGLPNLSVKLTAPQGEAVNLGTVLVGGGRIDLQAALVNQQGILRADRLGRGPGGRGGEVVLSASSGVDLGAASQTSTNGAAGGQVRVDGGTGTTRVAGSVLATGSSAAGGGITLLGRQVGLLDGALVDASGAAGGGAVRVGGGLQGRDAAYRNAEAVYMAPGATIAADATVNGDGGLVVLWSDIATRVYGALSARGGPVGGNGGFIETSGGWLDAQPWSVRTNAPVGLAGQWLLDPFDIVIANAGTEQNIGSGPNFTSSAAPSLLRTGTIEASLDTSDVTVTTGSGGTGSGTITMTGATIGSGDIGFFFTPRRLTLNAVGNIVISGSELGSFVGPLHIDLIAGGSVSISNNSLFRTAGGDLSITAPAVSVVDSVLNTSARVPGGGGSLPPISTGDIRVSANNLRLEAGTQLISVASATPIHLQGNNASLAMASFVNQAGVTALQAPNGRWLVQAGDSTALGFSPGALVADFWQFGVAATTPPAASGKGFLFAAAPTLAAAGFQRVYDGGTAIDRTALEATLTGLRPGLALVGAPVFSNSNAGQGVSVVLAANDLGQVVETAAGKPVYGYQVSAGAMVGDISPRPITLAAVTVANKVYDGSTAATVSSWTLSNVITGDAVQVAAGAGVFDSANTGSNKSVLATPTSLDGTAASNYSIGAASAIGSASISQRTLVLNSVSVADKVYDGSTAATVTNWSLSNVVTGDQVGVGAGSAQYSSPGVGTAKPVQATATGLTGTAAGNYNIDPQFGTVTGAASITARPLTMSNVAVADKVYDGNTAALVTNWTLSGLVGSEQVNTGLATGQFTTLAAGDNKPVRTTFSLLPGAGAANYVVADPAGGATAAITHRPLALASVMVADKVYDGGTAATVTSWALSNVVSGDQVQVSAGSGQFSTAGAGTAKPVLAVASSLGGADAGNYSLAAASQTGSASISQRPLSLVSVAVADKVYDGGTAATVTNWALSNVVSGDQVQVLAGSGQFSTAGAGSAKPVLAVASSLGGAAAANYSLVTASQTGSASISQRPLSLASVAVADKVYDGNTAATVTNWSLSNVVEGDQVQVLAGTGRFSTAGAGTAKPVLAIASSLGGADAGNYRLSTAASQSGSAAITPAPLRYLADPASTVSGQPLPALTGTVTGFVNGESLAGATTGNLLFSTDALPASPPGPYAVAGSGLAALNYRFSQAPGNASALTLTQAPAPSEPGTLPVNPFVTQSAVTLVLPPPEATSPASGRAIDALAVLRPGGGDRTEFASLDLASLSPAAVAGVLAARDEYKKTTFQLALAQLELDPTLADAPGCATAQQAATGQCLITAPLAGAQALSKARVDDRSAARPPGTGAAPSPAAAAAATAPVATTAPAATAAAPPPAATAAVRTAGAALLARPPQPVVDLPARRGVKTASLPQIQRKIALVIGIDQYSDARIPRLANAANDARAVAASLEAHLGYETVVLENANRSGIFRALNQLVGQVGPADSVVVYYAGHGERAEKSGLGYWQPADADPSRAETWISNADIDRLLRQLPASQVALISDSCYSGSLVSGERIRGATGPLDPATLLGRRATVVMTSGGNEPVFDSGKNGHSPFAWSLMQALQQVSTWKAGSSVFEQVRFAVARQLPQRPQYAAAPNAGHQAGADFLFEQRQLEGVVK